MAACALCKKCANGICIIALPQELLVVIDECHAWCAGVLEPASLESSKLRGIRAPRPARCRGGCRRFFRINYALRNAQGQVRLIRETSMVAA